MEQLAARLKILGNNYNQQSKIKFLNKINYKITKYWKQDQLKLIQNQKKNSLRFSKNLKIIQKHKLVWVLKKIINYPELAWVSGNPFVVLVYKKEIILCKIKLFLQILYKHYKLIKFKHNFYWIQLKDSEIYN